MFRILKKSLKTGVVTGEHPPAGASPEPASPETKAKAAPFCRSLSIREVDTGSCNACEMEMNALMNPVYDAERFGIHIAASPRHADGLLALGRGEGQCAQARERRHVIGFTVRRGRRRMPGAVVVRGRAPLGPSRDAQRHGQGSEEAAAVGKIAHRQTEGRGTWPQWTLRAGF